MIARCSLAACKPEALLCGIKIIQRALGIRRAAVVIPERGASALSRLRTAAAEDGFAELFRFITATEIYPMHEDAQLIYALAGPAMPTERIRRISDMRYLIPLPAQRCLRCTRPESRASTLR